MRNEYLSPEINIVGMNDIDIFSTSGNTDTTPSLPQIKPTQPTESLPDTLPFI